MYLLETEKWRTSLYLGEAIPRRSIIIRGLRDNSFLPRRHMARLTNSPLPSLFLSLSLSLAFILAPFFSFSSLRRGLEVLVRGVLVAVHLHARHVLLLRARRLIHLDEALQNARTKLAQVAH